MRNFNEIFRKVGTYDNIKSHKKPGLHTLSRRWIFCQNHRGCLIDSPKAFKWLKFSRILKPPAFS